MPQLDEVLTSGSVERLVEAFEAGMLIVDEKPQEVPTLRAHESDVTETLAKYVWHELRRTAQRDRKYVSYPWKTTWRMNRVLAKKGRRSPEQYRYLVNQITRALVYNGLALKEGRGMTGLYLADVWPAGLSFRSAPARMSYSVDPQTEKAIEREAKVERPVVVRHDLTIMPVPKMEPKAIKEWVERFVPTALEVQAERDALAARVAELERGLAEREEEAWSEVGEAISEAMAGTRVPHKTDSNDDDQ